MDDGIFERALQFRDRKMSGKAKIREYLSFTFILNLTNYYVWHSIFILGLGPSAGDRGTYHRKNQFDTIHNS